MLAIVRDRALEVHGKLQLVVEASRAADAHIARLLRVMFLDGLFHDLGYASMVAYGESLQLSPRKTRDLLRIAAHLDELPVLADAFERGDIAWTKARELVRVAIPETEAAWVEHAAHLTSRELERHVADGSPGALPPKVAPKDPPRRRLVVQMHSVDAQLIEDALTWVMAQAGLEAEEMDRGAALTALVRRGMAAAEKTEAPTAERYRVVVEHCPECRGNEGLEVEVNETIVAEACCDAEVVELRPGETQGHLSRTIPPAVRRTVLHRDRLACRVPGCGGRMWLDLHHVKPYAQGGGHTPENLVTLCSCHHRLLHEGLLAVTLVGGMLLVEHASGRKTWTPLVGGEGARVG